MSEFFLSAKIQSKKFGFPGNFDSISLNIASTLSLGGALHIDLSSINTPEGCSICCKIKYYISRNKHAI